MDNIEKTLEGLTFEIKDGVVYFKYTNYDTMSKHNETVMYGDFLSCGGVKAFKETLVRRYKRGVL